MVAIALGLLAAPALAQSAGGSGGSKNTATAAVPLDYDDISSEEDSRTLQPKGIQSMRQGGIDRALIHLKRAVEGGPKDVDAHAQYALALEAKMARQNHPNADLFGQAVQHWVLNYRGEVGEEKGITIKGVGLGAGMFSKDEMAMRGKEHLLQLVGFLPKPWETDTKYVKRAVKARIEAH